MPTRTRPLDSTAWAKSPSKSVQAAPSPNAILPTLRSTRTTIGGTHMTIHRDISRRHMLALSAAAGGAAASGLGAALAQQRRAEPAEVVLSQRIDQLDPALDKIIATSEP